MKNSNPYEAPPSSGVEHNDAETASDKTPFWLRVFLLVICLNCLAFAFAYIVAMSPAAHQLHWLAKTVLISVVSVPYHVGMWLVSDDSLCMVVGIPIVAAFETLFVVWIASLFRLLFPRKHAGSPGD